MRARVVCNSDKDSVIDDVNNNWGFVGLYGNTDLNHQRNESTNKPTDQLSKIKHQYYAIQFNVLLKLKRLIYKPKAPIIRQVAERTDFVLFELI